MQKKKRNTKLNSVLLFYKTTSLNGEALNEVNTSKGGTYHRSIKLLVKMIFYLKIKTMYKFIQKTVWYCRKTLTTNTLHRFNYFNLLHLFN